MSSSAKVQLTGNSLPIVDTKINQKSLPQDIGQTISKVRLIAIDSFAKISAFFNILKNWLFGNSKSFKKDYENLASEIANDKKLALYSNKKLNSEEKAFLTLLGTKISTFEELKDLESKIKKDMNVFNLFKAIASKTNEKEDIEKLLKKVKGKTPKNYKLVLKAANKLAVDQKVSEEIKNLLKSKLEKSNENSEMNRTEYKKPSKEKIIIPRRKETAEEVTDQKEIINREEIIPKAKEGLTTKKKIIIGGAAIAVATGIAAGLYYTMPGNVVEPVVKAVAEPVVKAVAEPVVKKATSSVSSEAGKQAIKTYGNSLAWLLKKSVAR